jgi:hypothetical protein
MFKKLVSVLLVLLIVVSSVSFVSAVPFNVQYDFAIILVQHDVDFYNTYENDGSLVYINSYNFIINEDGNHEFVFKLYRDSVEDSTYYVVFEGDSLQVYYQDWV